MKTIVDFINEALKQTDLYSKFEKAGLVLKDTDDEDITAVSLKDSDWYIPIERSQSYFNFYDPNNAEEEAVIDIVAINAKTKKEKKIIDAADLPEMDIDDKGFFEYTNKNFKVLTDLLSKVK